jgi:fatty acid desaturase
MAALPQDPPAPRARASTTPATSLGPLRYAADVRTMVFTALYFVLLGGAWHLVDLTPWALVAAIPVMSLWCFVGAVNVHNIMHAPPFKNSRYNEVYRWIATMWYGQPASLYVPVHNLSHHKHAQTRRDLTRSTKANTSSNLRNLFIATRWRQAALRDCKAYFAEQRRLGRRIWKQLRADIVVVLTFYAALLFLSPWKWLALVFVPHSVGQWGIKAINFMQHDGCAYDNEGYDHSRNFVGPWFNFLLFNNGYHTIHHLRPGLHWSVTPGRHAELIGDRMHPALAVPNFARWAWSNFVYPARRERYDGQAFERPPWGEGEDEPWFFGSDEVESDR